MLTVRVDVQRHRRRRVRHAAALHAGVEGGVGECGQLLRLGGFALKQVDRVLIARVLPHRDAQLLAAIIHQIGRQFARPASAAEAVLNHKRDGLA